MKPVKTYEYNGLAGCVVQRKARQTKTLVSVYHAEQAGLGTGESWVVVCETHSNTMARDSLRSALLHASVPQEWCGDCQDASHQHV